ncbi:MAG: sigma-70 family RNA polymerase sigma factor [Lachnospiraceae bacterium]|nr:sigma-70 family RNA polymerase sigma factor [Lachnospiraceae bacterium]
MKDEKVILGIEERDEQTMAYVIQKYSRLLWKVVYPILGVSSSEQDVEECVADVFIQLWNQPRAYDPAKAKLSTYLTIVARTKAIDRYRSIQRKREVPLEESVLIHWRADLCSQPLQSLLSKEKNERIHLMLKRLGEPMQEILVRRYFYDQKPREIALAMDMPKKQVENSLYGAKKRLRQMLEDEKGEFDEEI